jgi:N-acetyl-anhydromuramoyl-L-alanine amidase
MPVKGEEGRGKGRARASFVFTSEGLLENARYVPSPNCDERPAGCTVDLLVIHHISLPPGEFGGAGILDLFANRLDPAAHPYYATIAGAKVSAHFLVRRDGELIQFVSCAKRAWHAGESIWKGRTRCNDFSIGVELEGTGEVPFTDAQYVRLAELSRALAVRYPIADITGHSDIAPGRKTDPGPSFDWPRFRGLLDVHRRRAKKSGDGKSRRARSPRRSTRAKKKK